MTLASPWRARSLRPRDWIGNGDQGACASRFAGPGVEQKLPHASLQIRVGRPHSRDIRVGERNSGGPHRFFSTPGRTGWERALLGSTAERVIRQAPCPVLVARPTSRKKTELKLQKILVPLDFSACAARGLHYAIDLAKVFKAKLTLINVSQLHHDLPPVVIYSDAALNRWAAEVAEAHMADLVKETDFEGVEFETVHKNGSPARKICRYAVRGKRSHRQLDPSPNRHFACAHRKHGGKNIPLRPLARPDRAEPRARVFRKINASLNGVKSRPQETNVNSQGLLGSRPALAGSLVIQDLGQTAVKEKSRP